MSKRVWRHRITKAGQVSIPADVRQRWATSTVAIEDEGDRIVLRPVPDDAVEAYRGIFEGKGRELPASEAMRIVDESERRAEERKWRHLSSSTHTPSSRS